MEIAMRRPLTLILCAAIAASVFGSIMPEFAKLPLLIAVTVGTLALLISRRGQLSSGFSRTTLISFCGIGAIIMLVPVCAANARLEVYRELADSKLTDSDITVSQFAVGKLSVHLEPRVRGTDRDEHDYRADSAE